MATATGISIDDYLRTSYEGVDREYRDGEVIERSMPNIEHSIAKRNLVGILYMRRRETKLHVHVELRLRLSAVRVLIPDVCIFKAPPPTELVPTTPPYVVAEILSPADNMTDVLEKLEEYAGWGVTHNWLIDPRTHKLFTYTAHQLHEVSEFTLDEPALTVSAADLFSE